MSLKNVPLPIKKFSNVVCLVVLYPNMRFFFGQAELFMGQRHVFLGHPIVKRWVTYLDSLGGDREREVTPDSRHYVFQGSYQNNMLN